MTTATSTVHDLGNGHKCYTWPNCSIHNATPTKTSLTDEFNKRIDTLNKGITNAVPAIQKQTPTDIDDVLANLYYQESRVYGEIAKLRAASKQYQGYLDNGRYPHQADDYRRWIGANDAKIEELKTQVQDIRAEAKPGEAEYVRRGRWTRAFLAVSADGHVHSSMNCSTCNRDGHVTKFKWLTEYSGKDEAQIVDDAGRSACTTCYPSAPVETLNRASRIEDPEKKAAREAREKAKAERDAIKLQKGITNPDGSPVMFKHWSGSNGGQEIKTEVTAEREAVGILYDRKYTDLYAQPGSRAAEPSERAFHEEQLNILVDALAHKRGQTAAEVREFIEAKAQKKFDKEYRR